MNRLLVDTGPLVALCDDGDRLHERAVRELDGLKGALVVGLPVLTEAHFLLAAPYLRRRLAGLLAGDVVQVDAPRHAGQVVTRTLAWLERYHEHRPDFADGFLIAWAEAEADARIWTFDREFSSVWRTLGGRKVRLVAG